MQFYIGCSGWYYDEWKSAFYPDGLSKSEWLSYYAQHFSTVEVNNTFYSFPTPETVQSWAERVPSHFRFTFKAPRFITHQKKFKNTESQITQFYSTIGTLGPRLGCILFQIPSTIKKDMDFLEHIFSQLDLRRKNVLEFRHESWFSRDVYDVMKEHKVMFCTVSAPDLPKNTVVTGSDFYIRFHGKKEWYDYLYSEQELSSWSTALSDLPCDQVFCYFNNDQHAHAPQNALSFQHLCEQKK